MRLAFSTKSVRSAALRAANYIPALDSLRSGRAGRFRSVRLDSMLAHLGRSYWSVFKRLDCAPSHGVQLLSQTDMFMAEPEGRVIRLDSMPNPADHKVERWQLLIAGAGQMGEGNLFGRCIIADDRLAGHYLGPHAVALQFGNPGDDHNLWTYAFLCSRMGIQSVQSCAFGTSVPGLRLDLLRELPIPLPSDGMVMKPVATLIRTCVEQREAYLQGVRAARRLIQELPEMQLAHASCAVPSARATMWAGEIRTLGAWNYASSGDALSLLRRRWGARLRDALIGNGVFNGPRFARIDCDPPHGLEFMSQRDIFLIRPVPRRIARPRIPDGMLHVPKDAVLAGSHGQIGDGGIFGKVELASFAAHRCGLTQDVLRLLFRPEFRAVCYTFLSTIVGERLLKSTAVGTSIPSMRIDLLMDTPVPEVSKALAAKVESLIREAEQARATADAAESEAIRIIEEEVLPAWLA